MDRRAFLLSLSCSAIALAVGAIPRAASASLPWTIKGLRIDVTGDSVDVRLTENFNGWGVTRRQGHGNVWVTRDGETWEILFLGHADKLV
jgi:hypothetical protein